ncbi:MAG TPA: hypothetical protein VGQ90_00230, partial [Stellaceae bacterium]|nr:hypothetical protein [Stellaceae bacterium]
EVSDPRRPTAYLATEHQKNFPQNSKRDDIVPGIKRDPTRATRRDRRLKKPSLAAPFTQLAFG